MRDELEKIDESSGDNLEEKKSNKRRLIITCVILGVFIVAVITLMIIYWPYLYGIATQDEEIMAQFNAFLDSSGVFAWGILLLLMILQVVLAVLPNGAFEIMAGAMYGPFVGIFLSLLGTTLGVIIVVLLVRAFGKGFASLFVNLKDANKYKLLNEPKRCLIVMFGLLIIPGLPKDFLAFLVPFTSVKLWQFLIVNLIARTPVVTFSVVMGNSLVSGNYILAITLGLIALVIGVLCIIFNKKISTLFDKK